MAVQAKLQVSQVSNYFSSGVQSQSEVRLTAVYSSDPNSPNYSFSKYTPQAEFRMVITNPDALTFFEGGGEYIVTFEKA